MQAPPPPRMIICCGQANEYSLLLVLCSCVLLLLPLGASMRSSINSNVLVVPVCDPLPGKSVGAAGLDILVFNQKHFQFHCHCGVRERVERAARFACFAQGVSMFQMSTCRRQAPSSY